MCKNRIKKLQSKIWTHRSLSDIPVVSKAGISAELANGEQDAQTKCTPEIYLLSERRSDGSAQHLDHSCSRHRIVCLACGLRGYVPLLDLTSYLILTQQHPIVLLRLRLDVATIQSVRKIVQQDHVSANR